MATGCPTGRWRRCRPAYDRGPTLERFDVPHGVPGLVRREIGRVAAPPAGLAPGMGLDQLPGGTLPSSSRPGLKPVARSRSPAPNRGPCRPRCDDPDAPSVSGTSASRNVGRGRGEQGCFLVVEHLDRAPLSRAVSGFRPDPTPLLGPALGVGQTAEVSPSRTSPGRTGRCVPLSVCPGCAPERDRHKAPGLGVIQEGVVQPGLEGSA